MRVITGKARGVRLKTPEGRDTRPTTDRVKEALFSAIQFEIEGRRVLDLFAGSGQLGIEALSRGAEKAVFVDMSKKAVALVKENLRLTRLQDQAQVIQADYMGFLSRNRETFGLIFLDPPYAEDFLEKSLQNIVEFDILVSGGIIVTERPDNKGLDLEFPGYVRSKDYHFGSTFFAFYRKQ